MEPEFASDRVLLDVSYVYYKQVCRQVKRCQRHASSIFGSGTVIILGLGRRKMRVRPGV